MIIGITGGTGCGKTTALRAIAELGGTVIDCDEVYHRLLETDTALLDAIEARFPGTVLEGVLQRKLLGELVFSNEEALLDLNAITHSAVKAEVLRLLTPQPKLAAIDAIALFEGGLAQLCDTTVAITAPEESRIARLMAREGIAKEYATARIAAQKSNTCFSALCDHTLHNDETEEDFRAKCLGFFTSLVIIEENTAKENDHDN
ncbi:MAG: dephospho-CoA kinase [Oscillospiraceae bacterium]|nr:dephospho-CoA kinase [Oscillospiraceae bacterium]